MLLGRATSVFYNLVGTDTNDVRQKLRAEYAPKFSAHGDAISLNADLFARIKTLYEQRDSLGLDAQGVRLVERYYTWFVRNGANLSEADKAHLKGINGQMATLGARTVEHTTALQALMRTSYAGVRLEKTTSKETSA